ncbi:MAG: molybdopterin molybdotransferase MoeA [Verrucomicrobiota bacterium]
MISVKEAEQLILENIETYDAERVSLENALGRVLRESISADRDLPPFNRATLDGIAINYAPYASGQRSFPIAGTIAAGAPSQNLGSTENCVEIMTGAALPTDADTVIRIEDLEIADGIATIKADTSHEEGEGVHPAASDSRQGDTLLEANTQLTGKEISIAASVGYTDCLVSLEPRITLVTTGDELVSINQTPLLHQIRRSNDLALKSALASAGYADVVTLHLKDDKAATEKAIGQLMQESDVIILAGGVSKGKFDFLPKTLLKMGVEKKFQWVAQRPGKPLWFGHYDRDGRKLPVFALPGNPVSCFTCLHRYVIPALDKAQSKPAAQIRYAKLSQSFSFKPPLALFLPVVIEYSETGDTWAKPLPFNTSGDYISVARTDGFIELPAAQSDFTREEPFRYFPWQA